MCTSSVYDILLLLEKNANFEERSTEAERFLYSVYWETKKEAKGNGNHRSYLMGPAKEQFVEEASTQNTISSRNSDIITVVEEEVFII